MRFLLCACLLMGSVSSNAQLIGRKARAGDIPPKALLVELLTRPTQREYLKNNRPDLLPLFERDVEQVIKRTVSDFARNFKYCPVYFFYDSLADKVKEQDWAACLMDSSRQLIGNPTIIKPGDTTYYIVYYGSPIPQPEIVATPALGDLGTASEHYGDDPTSLFKEVLLACNYKFQVLPERMPRTNYFRKLRPPGISRDQYKFMKKSLFYNSERWYIDYIPSAYSYDATLRRFFREKTTTGT